MQTLCGDRHVAGRDRHGNRPAAPAPTIAKADRDDNLLLLVLRLVMTGTIEIADDALLDKVP